MIINRRSCLVIYAVLTLTSPGTLAISYVASARNFTKTNLLTSLVQSSTTASAKLITSSTTETATSSTLTKKLQVTTPYEKTAATVTQRDSSVTEDVKDGDVEKFKTSTNKPLKAVHSSRLQERLEALDCDLPVLPNESRLWRGNETHELALPLTISEDCTSGSSSSSPVEEECPPPFISWDAAADIQSGDILIVKISDRILTANSNTESKNKSVAINTTDTKDRIHQNRPQPAVYMVTRQGHEHCDTSDGMLLDITPLDDHNLKIITLYDKDLTEGTNLLIVVSENWGVQCVRLKVTVKSDNCGESQECSGKGVCYTNVSMDSYECQCCPGFAGPHCDERDACNPSPCLNNGICVDLTQPTNSGANYHCLCPYGFTGRKCEKDPCSSGPCQNGGSCMSMAMNGTTTFHCACAEGFTGAHCELSTAVGGACASNPCVNGICIEQTDNENNGPPFRCFCRPGYTGDKCEMEYNECESSPCANGGTCTDRIGAFTCSCGRGYNGNTCQYKVDLCSPNPCPSHQYCIDHGNIYSCECPHGYVGEECTLPTKSPCDNNPCAHGGTCWNGEESFFCSCRPGYTGRLCEDDFIIETVVGDTLLESSHRGSGSVREVHMPLGLYHDRLHNVYIAAGTLGAAITIVGVVVTLCHCRVNKTYLRLWGAPLRPRPRAPHWLERTPGTPRTPETPKAPRTPGTLVTPAPDMYYTLDFSDSQTSPLIQ